MARPDDWAPRVLALLRGGNTAAAMAQMKVAPSVRDLQALQKALEKAGLAGRWREVDAVLAESLAELSAPRKHRAP